MDPLAGNQRAYRLADYNARSISPRVGATGWVCRRTATRANRSALPGCRGRAWGEIFGREAADTEGVRAAGFTNRAQTGLAPFAGAWAFDHRSGRCPLDARPVYEDEPGKGVCGCRLGDERLDEAGSLRGDASHYENYAGREGKGRQQQTRGYCRPGLRDGRLLFAGLAPRRSAGR